MASLKVSAAQTSILCNFFEENPEVIRGYKRKAKRVEEVQNKWKNITTSLNAAGPPKDHKSWAKYLCDMKAKLKKKRIKWRQSSDGKGPVMCNAEDFDEIRLRMLQVLRKDVYDPQDTQDSHTSDLETEDDNYDADSHSEVENHLIELPDALPDLKPKLETFENNTSPDLQLPRVTFDDQFDYFGKNVAEQLRTLPLGVALETQQMLLAILKKQRLKVLNENFSSDPLCRK
uniref:Regulatory protein zeste n=1 Tax=Heliothis virescens TaxID=7102 RepID=A0A2A4J0Q0_HELVI